MRQILSSITHPTVSNYLPTDMKKQTSLGSGLIDQSQKMTVAAMQMAEKKVWAHLS